MLRNKSKKKITLSTCNQTAEILKMNMYSRENDILYTIIPTAINSHQKHWRPGDNDITSLKCQKKKCF